MRSLRDLCHWFLSAQVGCHYMSDLHEVHYSSTYSPPPKRATALVACHNTSFGTNLTIVKLLPFV